MAKTMRILIERKKYSTQQEVVDRLNSFMIWGQTTVEEYEELMLLAENTYNSQVEEPTTEPPIVEEEVIVQPVE